MSSYSNFYWNNDMFQKDLHCLRPEVLCCDLPNFSTASQPKLQSSNSSWSIVMLLLGHRVNFPGKNQRKMAIDCNPVILKIIVICVVMFIFQISLMLLSRDFSLPLWCKCNLYIIIINVIYIFKGHYPVLMNNNTRSKFVRY